MTPADISVVIPTINEENSIGIAIESALRAGAVDVIVADGGSTDRTADCAATAGATKVIRSLPGRGIQLNSGAVFAEKGIVLFLHADSRLAANCLQQICDHGDIVWGAFRQRIDSPQSVFRWIEELGIAADEAGGEGLETLATLPEGESRLVFGVGFEGGALTGDLAVPLALIEAIGEAVAAEEPVAERPNPDET